MSPKLAIPQQGGRSYVWPPPPAETEHVVPSVTRILGMMAKPALPNWAAKSVAEFAYDHRDTWIDLDRDAAVDVMKRAPWRHTKSRMNLGSAVHAAVEARLLGKPPVEGFAVPSEPGPDMQPWIDGALRFIDEQLAPDWLDDGHIEATVFNLTYAYAGTADLFARGRRDNAFAVIDWKTGKGLYPEVGLQLAAYAAGEFIGVPDGERLEVPPVEVGIAVHLHEDGSYTAVRIPMNERLWRTFVALRTLQHFQQHLAPSLLCDELPRPEPLRTASKG